MLPCEARMTSQDERRTSSKHYITVVVAVAQIHCNIRAKTYTDHRVTKQGGVINVSSNALSGNLQIISTYIMKILII